MRGFLRSLGRRMFGYNPATAAVVGSKAVKVPSLGERLAKAFRPPVAPRSPYSGAARSDAVVHQPKNPRRPRNARGRCERNKRRRLHKARR